MNETLISPGDVKKISPKRNIFAPLHLYHFALKPKHKFGILLLPSQPDKI